MPYFLDIVKKLENKTDERRRNIIIKILKNKIFEKQSFSGRRKSKAFSSDIKFKLESYNYKKDGNFQEIRDSLNFPIKNKSSRSNYFATKGTNIIVDIGKGKKYSVVSAHYDAVPGSPGANDDASGIAVLFKLIENLRKIKLKNKIRIMKIR